MRSSHFTRARTILSSSLVLSFLALPLAADEPMATTATPRVDTYTAYERRIQRMESVWPDARAVTVQQPDGQFSAVLVDRKGNDVARRSIAAPDPFTRSDSAAPGTIPGERSVSRVNEELDRERRAAATRMPSRVTIDFGDFISDSFLDPIVPVSERRSRTAYSTFHTVLRDKQTGEQIGIVRWFDNEEVLVWDFPGFGSLGSGFASPERLAAIGGWTTFRPDMVWAGIQALVFRDSYDRVQTRRDSGRLSALEITTQNCDGLSDGCTGLHWLDGTVFRACCDQHDLCYEYSPPDGCCSVWSWIFPYSWRCVSCNIQVVSCFFFARIRIGGGGGGIDDGGGGTADCYLIGCAVCWCPAFCRACEREF